MTIMFGKQKKKKTKGVKEAGGSFKEVGGGRITKQLVAGGLS